MKTLLLFVTLLIVASSDTAAAETTNSLPSTNGMIFACENGWNYTATNIILRDHVRVLDQASDMYLECDLLTIWLQTNLTKQARTNRNPALKTQPPAQTNQIDSSRFDSIIAEGNVYIVTTDQQVAGDRAVYYTTNDLVVITGEMVILGRDDLVGLGKKVIFDRTSGNAHGEGPFTFESLGKFSLGGTNSPARKRTPNTQSIQPLPPK